MSISLEPKLKIGSLLPAFELKSLDGSIVNIWDFKEQQDVVLVFLHGGVCDDCIEFLKDTVANYPQYEDNDTVVLTVIRGNMDEAVQVCENLCPPFPILYDETGKVSDMYTGALPAIFVADRYGSLRAEWIIGPDGSFPTQKEVLDVVELENLECPECGDVI